jgi:hypothetical protein
MASVSPTPVPTAEAPQPPQPPRQPWAGWPRLHLAIGEETSLLVNATFLRFALEDDLAVFLEPEGPASVPQAVLGQEWILNNASHINIFPVLDRIKAFSNGTAYTLRTTQCERGGRYTDVPEVYVASCTMQVHREAAPNPFVAATWEGSAQVRLNRSRDQVLLRAASIQSGTQGPFVAQWEPAGLGARVADSPFVYLRVDPIDLHIDPHVYSGNYLERPVQLHLASLAGGADVAYTADELAAGTTKTVLVGFLELRLAPLRLHSEGSFQWEDFSYDVHWSLRNSSDWQGSPLLDYAIDNGHLV